MGRFDYDKYKDEEQDYGIGKIEDLEFKVIRHKDGWYYEGEVKKGTIIRHGRGFCLGNIFNSNEEFLIEGFFKDDKLHGKCMEITKEGFYELGERTEG